jgi:SAM-dependent methyltransferase
VTPTSETERVLAIYKRMADGYDRMVSTWERLLFDDGEMDLRLGDAQVLSFLSDSFDTVVVTLTLCAVPDDRQVVREIARLLRPGGRLVWLERVRSPITPVRWVQRLLDPLLVRLEADHQLRDPLDHKTREPFIVERLERSRFGYIERGVARRQSAGLA